VKILSTPWQKPEVNISLLFFVVLSCVYVHLPGCIVTTWFVSLRDEHRLGVFESRLLRKIFGPKRDKLMAVVEKTT
jgi:hypothetical protein